MGIVRHLREREVIIGEEPYTGWIPPGAAEPRPAHRFLDLEIVDDSGDYVFAWKDRADPESQGHSHHDSLDAALEHAEAVFGIEPNEWQDGNPGDR